jgi:alpha-glucosidase
MQDHLYSKTRPENIGFLQRIRALLDSYDNRALVGEVGEGRRAIAVMADYTRGEDRLHMAYSFDLLGPQFTAAHFRSRIEGFFAGAPDGWPCWAFSNHDVIRHVTRWSDAGTQDGVARLSAALLLSLQGSICLYQGEELGQAETDIAYHELTDPPGFAFWPDYKGRDGCRTPMVWDATALGGFTEGRPWLPVKPPQLSRNVASQDGIAGSVLETYRQMLAWRRAHPALRMGQTRFVDLPEPVLAFFRDAGQDGLLCVFNLSPDHVLLTLDHATLVGPSQAADLSGRMLSLGPNAFAFAAASGATRLRPYPV